MMSVVLYFIASFALLYFLLPKQSKQQESIQRLRRVFGFEDAKKQARQAGIELKLKEYLLLIGITGGIGLLVTVLTQNWFMIVVAVIAAFGMPKIYFMLREYQHRKAILESLPGNCRLLVTKIMGSSSLLLALQRSLSLMNGPTEMMFREMYRDLELGAAPEDVLRTMRGKVNFRKFDNFCSRLQEGSRAGYHAKTTKELKESIKDMQKDIRLLHKLDIQNRAKILKTYIVVGMISIFPVLLTYLESNAIPGNLTYQQPVGQFLIAFFVLFIFTSIYTERKYMRLDLSVLK